MTILSGATWPFNEGRFYWWEVVSRIFSSWNQLDGWLWQVERLRLAADIT